MYGERFFMHADRAVSTPGELEAWVRVMANRTQLDDAVLVEEGVTFTRMAIIEKPPANLRDPGSWGPRKPEGMSAEKQEGSGGALEAFKEVMREDDEQGVAHCSLHAAGACDRNAACR